MWLLSLAGVLALALWSLAIRERKASTTSDTARLASPLPSPRIFDAAPAPSSIDASPVVAPDAGVIPPIDARVATRSRPDRDRTRADRQPDPRNQPAQTAEPGALKVGANPWADVYLDGQRLGRAPNSWPVPTGRHTVEVVFPVPGREQRRSYEIDIRPGEQQTLGVIDFSRTAVPP